MKRILKTIIFTSLIITACSLPFISDSQMSAETAIPTAGSTETAISVTTPTEAGPTASATPEFAPFCEPDAANVSPPAQCQIPIAEESSTFCADKHPYNLILINQGSTYEALTGGFRCSDAGVKKDRQMVTCTGQMAAPFEISVCDPACVVPTIQAEITQCPQDFNYNNVQGCCTQELQQISQNCVVLKLRTTSCAVDCSVFTKKSNCNKNSNACVWDSENDVCQLRK